MMEVPTNHVQLSVGVVHRTKAPCYIVDRDAFESACKYILAGGKEGKDKVTIHVEGDEHVDWAIMELPEEAKKRQAAWLTARIMLEDTIKRNGLTVMSTGSPFAPSAKYSPAEQELALVKDLADWLLEGF